MAPVPETLYVGMDDSNHAADANKKGEIIVAYASPCHPDGIVRTRRQKRHTLTKKDLSLPYDFRFTILTGGRFRFRSSAYNLVETAPLLVPPLLEGFGGVTRLNLYLDGHLPREGRRDLREQFSSLESVVVDNFPKKKGRSDSRSPKVVYVADSIAHNLFHSATSELLSHEKFIPFR